jgi:hypothetical protein
VTWGGLQACQQLVGLTIDFEHLSCAVAATRCRHLRTGRAGRQPPLP